MIRGRQLVWEYVSFYKKYVPGCEEIELVTTGSLLGVRESRRVVGEYELTFYTRNFLGSDDEQIGEYPKPCTIRFKIEGNTNWLDSQVVWPEDEK